MFTSAKWPNNESKDLLPAVTFPCVLSQNKYEGSQNKAAGDAAGCLKAIAKLLSFCYLGSLQMIFSATKPTIYVSNVINQVVGSEVTYGRKILGS